MATTTFMTLNLPVPTVTIGPEWASQLNTVLERVDQHDHTSGNGVKITVPALDINTDLTFKNNNATNLNSARFGNNSSPLIGLQDIRAIYVAGGDLYYNNSAGSSIQITAGGGLNVSASTGIGGDYASSSALVFYTNASKIYTFDQTTNTRAKLDIADVTIREAVASAEGITIKSPTSLSASYNITLPSGLPASGTKIMTINSSGGVGASYDVDDSTLEVSGSTLRVKDGGITRAKINSGFSSSNTDTVNISGSTTSTSFTTLSGSASVTTTSGPIIITINDIDSSGSCFTASSGGQIRILKNGSFFKQYFIGGSGESNKNGFTIIDTPSAGSTNAYSLQIRSLSTGVAATAYATLSIAEIL